MGDVFFTLTPSHQGRGNDLLFKLPPPFRGRVRVGASITLPLAPSHKGRGNDLLFKLPPPFRGRVRVGEIFTSLPPSSPIKGGGIKSTTITTVAHQLTDG